MNTNEDNLKFVYQKLSVLEMVGKLSVSTVDWLQLSTAQFKCTIEQNNDVWDIILTQKPDLVSIDFSKNGRFFHTLTSNDEPLIVSFFEELVGDEDYRRDKDLLKDVIAFEGCR